MGGEPFVWASNKDVSSTLFDGHVAEQLPQVAHGLNRFKHIHNIIDLSARLPSPAQFSFLSWRGVNAEDVRRAVHGDAVYQLIMRCSLRDIDNRNAKRIVVADRSSAEHLNSLLPGSTVEKLYLDTDEVVQSRRPGRKREFDDVAARVRSHRAKAKARAARSPRT